MKYLFLSILGIFFFLSVSAQPTTDQNWGNIIGGLNNEQVTSLAIDKEKNTYIAGTFSNGTINFGNNILLDNSNGGIFFAKYDPQGNCIWAKTIANAVVPNDNSIHLTLSPDGQQVHIAGVFKGGADFDPGPNSNNIISSSNYIYLAKYAASTGQFIGVTHVNITDAQVTTFETDLQNNLIIGGDFGGTLNIASASMDSYPSNRDVFIAKFDNNFNFKFARSLGSEFISDVCNDIVIDNLGNIYLTGLYKSGNSYIQINGTGVTVPFPPPVTSVSNSTAFLIKYSQEGDFMAAKSIESDNLAIGKALAIDEKNNLYLTGFYVGRVSLTSNLSASSKGSWDTFFVKFNPSLDQIIMANTLGGNGEDIGHSIALHEKILYIGGSFASSNLQIGNSSKQVLASKGGSDGLLAMFSTENGEFIYATQAGSSNTSSIDAVWALVTDKEGSLYMAATFGSPTANTSTPFTLDFCAKKAREIRPIGKADIVLAKYNWAPTLEVNFLADQQVKLSWDNPFCEANLEGWLIELSTNNEFDNFQPYKSVALRDISLIDTLQVKGLQYNYRLRPIGISNTPLSYSNIAAISLGGVTSLADNNERLLKLWPNPAQQLLQIQLPALNKEDKNISYRIIDSKGQAIRNSQLPASWQLDVSDIPPGLYLLKIHGKNTYYQRFVKQ